MNQLPSKVKKNTMNKYLPLGFFPFFQQRCVIGLLRSCEIICLGTGWHHQGENSITILYSAQVKLTVSLIHLLLKSYSMSLPSKIKKKKKSNLLELSLISYAHCKSTNTGSHAAGQEKGSGKRNLLASGVYQLALLPKAWSVKYGSKYSLQFTDPNLPLLLLAQ